MWTLLFASKLKYGINLCSIAQSRTPQPAKLCFSFRLFSFFPSFFFNVRLASCTARINLHFIYIPSALLRVERRILIGKRFYCAHITFQFFIFFSFSLLISQESHHS